MKTLTIYPFTELSEKAKDFTLRHNGSISCLGQLKPKREFIKNHIQTWVNEYFSKNPNEIKFGRSLFGGKIDLRPTYIFDGTDMKIRIHCRDFNITKFPTMRFCKLVQANPVKGSKGEVFIFDEKGSSFTCNVYDNHVWIDVTDPIEYCLLPDDIQEAIKQTKDWFDETEAKLSEECTKYALTLDYEAYVKEFDEARQAEILEYFENKFFFEDGKRVPVEVSSSMDGYWK